MKLLNTLAALMLAAILMNATSATLRADALEAEADERSERAEREADLYETGTDYIDDGKWEKAIRAFAKVVEMKGSRADGALYWTAYALNRTGRRTEALSTIDQLGKSYPASKWINDAKALEIEVRKSKGERVATASAGGCAPNGEA